MAKIDCFCIFAYFETDINARRRGAQYNYSLISEIFRFSVDVTVHDFARESFDSRYSRHPCMEVMPKA